MYSWLNPMEGEKEYARCGCAALPGQRRARQQICHRNPAQLGDPIVACSLPLFLSFITLVIVDIDFWPAIVDIICFLPLDNDIKDGLTVFSVSLGHLLSTLPVLE